MKKDLIITFNKVSFSYNHQLVLKDSSCEVFANDLISLVGPNGGGKTTFIKLLAGLLIPVKGTVLIESKSPEKSRMKIGYVPQYNSFDPKFPLSVHDVVISGALKNKIGFYSKKDLISVDEALKFIELYDKKRMNFHELSGGQRQRVVLARAIVSNPEILLLDEPLANIDPENSKKIIQLLEKLNSKMTILLATHDYSFVSSISKRVFCINRHIHEHPLEEAENIYGRNIMRVNHNKVLNNNKNCIGCKNEFS